MKLSLHIFLSLIFLAVATNSFAFDDGGCGSEDCRLTYCSECECTDPVCGNKGYNNCLSKSECCEAFGNVGSTRY